MSPLRWRKPAKDPAPTSPSTPPRLSLPLGEDEEEMNGPWSPPREFPLVNTNPSPSDPFTDSRKPQPAPALMGANPISQPQGNKTSQYIDKITAENERLRRELKAEKLAREEDTQRIAAFKAKAEESRTEYLRLQTLVDTNKRAIERKDRKLEEYKAAVEAETKRRISAEESAAGANRLLGDVQSDTQRQLAEALERRHQAETGLTAARDGFKRLTDSYERRIKSITKDFGEFKRLRAKDLDQIQRQLIVSDQQAQEVTKILNREGQMKDMLGNYQKDLEKRLDTLLAESEERCKILPRRDAEIDEGLQELHETLNKMKWTMTQHRRQESNSSDFKLHGQSGISQQSDRTRQPDTSSLPNGFHHPNVSQESAPCEQPDSPRKSDASRQPDPPSQPATPKRSFPISPRKLQKPSKR